MACNFGPFIQVGFSYFILTLIAPWWPRTAPEDEWALKHPLLSFYAGQALTQA
jgi:hypothetical protein